MGLFNFWKKKDTPQDFSNTPIKVRREFEEKAQPEFFNKIHQDKKNLLPNNSMTKEEILKEIEKQYLKSNMKGDNPFKTREDVYYCFYSPEMELIRTNVPFEEIKIAGKSFYINKKYENGDIIVEELYPKPELEIDLKSEFARKETTKAQLEKINNYILTINNEISKGNEQYKLIDIKDLQAEKYRLEKILSSIKYGKSAIFRFQNPYNAKPTYFMKYCNGEYKYLKVTEHNFLTEENSVKAIKGQTIIQKITEILNLRLTKNWKDILLTLMAIVIFFGAIFVFWKMGTFEETLFDQRVQTFCGDSLKLAKEQMLVMRDLQCNSPALNQTLQNLSNTGFNVAK